MPILKVHSSQFMVHSHKKTINHQPPTINKRPRRLGFSLIELLVVIVILGILSSFVTYTMVGRQKQARDAQRKSDLQTFKKAMEAAKADCRSSAYYPRILGGLTVERLNYIEAGMVHLPNENLKYLPTAINDPKFNISDPFNSPSYLFTFGNSSGLNCPNSSNPPAKNAFDATETWVARAKLEVANDPDANKSRQACQNAIDVVLNSVDTGSEFSEGNPAQDDGYYYACSN